MSSTAFAAAASWRRGARTDFELVRQAAYELAELETNGRMLNRRGMAAGIETWELFTRNSIFAQAYASEELLEHWRANDRPTFAAYEAQLFPGIFDY